jgi:acyl-CoA reductase-like NAD-dependent aldehyde dehydrogenase
MINAFIAAGIPAEAFCMYPGGHDVGGTIMSKCDKSMIFGSAQTVQQYSGNPRVQAHGPGFSKILLGDDIVDHWEDYLDLMVESVASNSGRGCINCSGIWASRHTREIAEALAARIGPIDALSPIDDKSELAAFTNPQMATGTWSMIQQDLSEAGVQDMTASYGPRLIERERCAYLRPMVVHADSPARGVAAKEYMFPFASVVKCEQKDMIKSIGQTLIGTAITADERWIDELTNAVNIDRLNIGPVPTNRLNWLQPHEGNLIDFLFRSRAYQIAPFKVPVAAT